MWERAGRNGAFVRRNPPVDRHPPLGLGGSQMRGGREQRRMDSPRKGGAVEMNGPDRDWSINPVWLEERYPMDAAARNRQLEQTVVESFKGVQRLRLLDVGAGLGANTRYYLEVFPGDQHWLLVEREPALAVQCRLALAAHAARKGWDCAATSGGLVLQLPRKRVTVELIEGSLLKVDTLVDLDGIDLVTANAVFDTLSRQQFNHFAQSLARHRLPLLATLLYRSAHFEPAEQRDGTYLKLYEQHMIRPRSFGSAMGPACSRYMMAALSNLNMTVSNGKSDWRITSAHPRMMNYMLDFMQQAIGEMILSSTDHGRLKQWVEAKRKQLTLGKVNLFVSHTDLFGRFSESG